MAYDPAQRCAMIRPCRRWRMGMGVEGSAVGVIRWHAARVASRARDGQCKGEQWFARAACVKSLTTTPVRGSQVE